MSKGTRAVGEKQQRRREGGSGIMTNQGLLVVGKGSKKLEESLSAKPLEKRRDSTSISTSTSTSTSTSSTRSSPSTSSSTSTNSSSSSKHAIVLEIPRCLLVDKLGLSSSRLRVEGVGSSKSLLKSQREVEREAEEEGLVRSTVTVQEPARRPMSENKPSRRTEESDKEEQSSSTSSSFYQYLDRKKPSYVRKVLYNKLQLSNASLSRQTSPRKFEQHFMVEHLPLKTRSMRKEAREIKSWFQGQCKIVLGKYRNSKRASMGRDDVGQGVQSLVDYVQSSRELVTDSLRRMSREMSLECSEQGEALNVILLFNSDVFSSILAHLEKIVQDCREREQEKIRRVSGHSSTTREEVMVDDEESGGHEEEDVKAQGEREEELMLELMSREETVTKLSNKYERTKKLCRKLTHQLTTLRDILNDAQDGFKTCSDADSAKMLLHSFSWSRRPENQRHKQEAHRLGYRDDPQDILSSITAEKIESWESMHDSIFDRLNDAGEKLVQLEARLQVHDESMRELELENAQLKKACLDLEMSLEREKSTCEVRSGDEAHD
ncbi:hypothetical protein GUITHDRAFT_148589 [Guillardia theta CCMP2712]|uniref:Uncharacterized protein n=1 Tax=Guillardia theta (strain CCMP2712) TaxID=905079 RepID=L1I8B0_GUITC|nr:hypothetical protein GUITHDRAFT_148589 [Guillardia theta CCMP2712]EKX32511.1 hypothetical protein GUITHDRAFT_148589 [Guillardia theta CCMP2712]|eukprot:XP_005819491.1 hypothetical protein GUITHDRAFT_148589 [Guillardia theta CCMP2712]